MRSVATAVLALILSSSFVVAEDLSNGEKLAFVEFYQNWSKLKEEFPDHTQVQAFFVDIDGDYISEAFATSHGSTYETGSDWTAFRRTGNDWNPISGIDPHSKEVRPVFAPLGRNDEFYLMHERGTADQPHLVIIHKDFDKLAPDGKAPAKVTGILMNQEGVLSSTPVSSLDEVVAYSAKFSSLKRLTVEVFADRKPTGN